MAALEPWPAPMSPPRQQHSASSSSPPGRLLSSVAALRTYESPRSRRLWESFKAGAAPPQARLVALPPVPDDSKACGSNEVALPSAPTIRARRRDQSGEPSGEQPVEQLGDLKRQPRQQPQPPTPQPARRSHKQQEPQELSPQRGEQQRRQETVRLQRCKKLPRQRQPRIAERLRPASAEAPSAAAGLATSSPPVALRACADAVAEVVVQTPGRARRPSLVFSPAPGARPQAAARTGLRRRRPPTPPRSAEDAAGKRRKTWAQLDIRAWLAQARAARQEAVPTPIPPRSAPGSPPPPRRNSVSEQALPCPRSPLLLGSPKKVRARHRSETWIEERWAQGRMLEKTHFSEVSLVADRARRELRVLKRINKQAVQNYLTRRKSKVSLKSEVELMRHLQHRGIVRLYEHFETDNYMCLVLEYVPGGDLFSFLLNGALPEVQARRLFRELCQTVKHLHDQGVVHRDLKPENILLTCNDPAHMHFKLADFGISRRTKRSYECSTFVGSMDYLAPEVWRLRNIAAGAPRPGYGRAADMWSLGVILYTMLSGVQPFDGSLGQDDLGSQVLSGKWDFDVADWRLVSPGAKDLVRSLLRQAPEERLTIDETLAHQWLQVT